ncbi:MULTISPECIES: hypothetical protein [Clostridia]|jgi:hypothetical protein|uniref:Uncharacterized protein n=1 Tax=Muricomes intestini TaxID=1796634 RepID=A0A4R3K4S2_9FIRM|nr:MULTISPECIES: hypothetical protein [Clostridia]TCS77759.1 hypothetical protein EDD59_11578 [Muricomes intestini]CUX14855.1 hypothetical protein BN3456_00064 [Clostridium sp. C105KSO13]
MSSKSDKQRLTLDELLDTLQAQITEQSKIMDMQEETIRVLEEQNRRLLDMLDKVIHPQ